MNKLQFDFTVENTANAVVVNKEFAADLPLVWDAFTKKEILDQWWAPKPWVCKTKNMDFEVGGQRFYAMVSPEGQQHWSIEKFTSINPETDFTMVSSFANQDGNIDTELPGSAWKLSFEQQNANTKVSITITHKTMADLEKQLLMGFKEGLTMTLNELDTLLSSAKKINNEKG